ncbi:DNA polymerase delta small subunit [Spathaspora sp. JA1]|nr:DNA polymerase delta small subunit [Spathaspora sp. JA1]
MSQYLNQNLANPTLTRPPSKITPGEEFLLSPQDRNYNRQYYTMYQYRFAALKSRIEVKALEKWGDGVRRIDGQTIFKQDKILDISSGKLCWVIGTVFIDAPGKLNILKDVDNGVDDVLPSVPETYVGGESGVIMLEDESGRAILSNSEFLDKNLLVTGCVVGVLGIEIQAGVFEIMDVVYPASNSQTEKIVEDSSSTSKVALVSGLNISSIDDLKIELLKQYLIGELGSNEDKQFNGGIGQLIIAGDSIEPLKQEKGQDFMSTNNYGTKNISKYNTDSLKKLQEFVNDVIVSLPIAVMPGANDPGEICLPQQPLHRSLVGNLSYGDRLTRLTNPQWMNIDGLKLLGSSGQNIDDIKKYLKKEEHTEATIDIMKSAIKWQNIAPTAPDTLYCYPYDNSDPFIIKDDVPHIFFVGNQDKYASEVFKYNGSVTTLISLPKFSETGQFVVVDLKTLECEVVEIEC